jgi:hypothetical protein
MMRSAISLTFHQVSDPKSRRKALGSRLGKVPKDAAEILPDIWISKQKRDVGEA